MVAFSDGICEQPGPCGEAFDVQGAVERAARATSEPAPLLEAVWRQLEAFRGPVPLRDDVTLIAARIGAAR